MKRRMTFAVTGDSFITRHQPGTDAAFRDLVKLIGRADVRFTNLEVTVHDCEGYPAAGAGGTWAAAHPSVLEDLQKYGFNLFSTANNHAFDYTAGGLLATLAHLDAAGLVHAGTGKHLAAAAAPGYLDTPSGRAALVAACSTVEKEAVAGGQRRDGPGRPGMNPLRMEATHIVLPETLEKLKKAAGETYINAYQDLMRKEGFSTGPADGDDVWMFGSYRFAAGARPGRKTVPLAGDLERLVQSVGEAARQADYVLVSLHSHEMAAEEKAEPADFLIAAAKACIDSGAHAVIGHGPHVLRGLEIYRGRPIFYSLGNFIFQSETVAVLPADFYAKYGLGPEHSVADALDARTGGDTGGLGANPAAWESLIPFFSFTDDHLDELVLYPVSLGYGLPRYTRGWPELSGDTGVLERFAQLSEPFGTGVDIDLKTGTGRVRLKE